MTSARWCKPPTKGLMDISNPDDHTAVPTFSGSTSHFADAMFSSVYHRLPFKVNTSGSSWDYTHPTDYHPCLALARDNLTDLPVPFFAYPTHTPFEIEDVLPVEQFLEDKVVILSSYNLTKEITRVDIARDSVATFESETWIAITVYFFMFVVVMEFLTRLSVRQRSSSFSSLWEVFCYFIEEEQIEVSGASRRVLVISLTVFSFYILGYFRNYMHTESVVIKRPRIINQYRDLVDIQPPIKIYALDIPPVYDEFRDNVQQDSDAAILSPQVTFIADLSLEPLSRLMPQCTKGYAVLLLPRVVSKFVLVTFIKSGLLNKDDDYQHIDNLKYRMWTSSDPSGLRRLLGINMRTEYARTNPFGIHVRRRMKQMHECGLMKHMIDMLDEGIDAIGANLPYHYIREMAREDVLLFKVEESPQTKLITLYGVLKVACFAFGLAVLILVCERYARPIVPRSVKVTVVGAAPSHRSARKQPIVVRKRPITGHPLLSMRTRPAASTMNISKVPQRPMSSTDRLHILCLK